MKAMITSCGYVWHFCESIERKKVGSLSRSTNPTLLVELDARCVYEIDHNRPKTQPFWTNASDICMTLCKKTYQLWQVLTQRFEEKHNRAFLRS
jgi:hypothetical protein